MNMILIIVMGLSCCIVGFVVGILVCRNNLQNIEKMVELRKSIKDLTDLENK